jgi:hypothetical protein
MRRLTASKWLVFVLGFLAVTAGAGDLSGRYLEESEPSLVLNLQESSDGETSAVFLPNGGIVSTGN